MKKQKKNVLALRGLSPVEVLDSRKRYGSNVITPPPKTPWWKLYLEKFEDPIIRILIIAALIAIGVGTIEGNYLEGIGIILAIFLATTLSFLNEFKASKEFDILNKVSDDEPVKVIREGSYHTIPKRDVVVSDIIIIEMGEEIPADGYLLDSVSLQVNESSLTGESVPVSKFSMTQLKETVVKERTYPADKVLRGTLVVDGHGIVLVTEVGDQTEIGKTAKASSEETGRKTPLNLQLEKLSKIIGVFGFSIAALTFIALVSLDIYQGDINPTNEQWYVLIAISIGVLISLYRVWLPIIFDALDLMGKHFNVPEWVTKNNIKVWSVAFAIGAGFTGILLLIGVLSEYLEPQPEKWLTLDLAEEFLRLFMISVTMIVVAIPEGLPMSVTLSLAYSIRKMTASNNLVRKMHAVETISAATVICSDKTGTLTMNEMRIHQTHFPLLKDEQKINTNAPSYVEKILLESIAANTTANLSKESDGKIKVLGNPTEGALLMWLDSMNINYDDYRKLFDYVNQWTFTTERKYMATFGISNINSKGVLYVKGAPEIILSKCKTFLTEDGLEDIESHKDEIKEKLQEYQNKAMRTLALALVESPTYSEGIELEEIAQNMIWLGFVAIVDPIRPEVPDAIRSCLDAGIQVKIVTGDTPLTAKEIGKQIGLWTEEDTEEKNLMLGPEFEKTKEDVLAEKILDLKILSRARPMDKLRLVKMLQKKDQVVAVTGDGTNDAPALNYADVGLSMGKSGTAVAKDASDIILLDDSFQSIVNAVMWGRSLYLNIQRFILFQLTINVLALLMVLIGPFIGIKLTLTVTQMIWVNLIMDTFAALALATQPPSWSVMKKPPRKPSDFIISKTMSRGIFITAFTFLIFLTATLLYMQSDAEGVTNYDLSFFFNLFVFMQVWNLFNAKSLGTNASALSSFLENKSFVIILFIIIAMQVIIINYGGQIFRTVPLSFKDWFIIIGVSSIVLWVGEIIRFINRKKYGIVEHHEH